MTNPDTVEAVAKVICEPDGCMGSGCPGGCKAWHLAQAAISAHLKALEAEGMVIVPEEPTDKMLEAVHPALQDDDCYREDWRAMITAHKDE